MQRLQPHEEKLLFNKIATGDEMAFRIIYDAYFDRLAAYAFKMSKSEDASEEIIQDVFMKLWTNRAVLLNVELPQAYLFSIARNKTIDYLRKLAKETTLIALLAENIQYHTNNAEKRIETQDLRALIAEAIAQLSPQKQKIFRLSKYDDLSHDEIAEELNLSKSTIKNHLSETMQYLRRNLKIVPNSEILVILILIDFIKKQ
ncbi:RNA polymerase sigma-70 factor (ECF subfamily) [Mucilaginibacter gracilis]|uniref:RNA polymerase sigma-70 factor (ECF subfamily) n=1 Tax=Mucilaginibacter gracilis TaxID=423350 RepID=A0A495J9N1_9SPHI|nr:RNA polymerase sigma-70 factor [Mucilaginibacter gracilis]RKR85092.1 RNA polymerase sigma-70 factor (ECF subfamily) [Mucilaginibacter gracilis]